MFRPATIKEVENLLRSQHILRGHGRDPVLPVFPPPRAEGYANKEEKDKAYKKALSDQVRESMLAQASKYLLGELRDAEQRKVLQEGTGLSFHACEIDCLERGTSCPKCQEVCTNFAEGVLTVLERDFVQLTHGKGAKLLQNRLGVQFILTGICLGLLYESLPESSGVNELVLQVLIIMLDLRVWTQALELYGPAPHRVYMRGAPIRVQTERSKEAPRLASPYPADMSRSASRRSSRRSTGPMKAIQYDPKVCAQCQQPFADDETIQECDCGAVTVRYLEHLLPTQVEDKAADLPPRPRAHTI